MAPDTTSSAEETVIFSSGDPATPPDLRLLHFNDVYHVDASSAEPVGGFARFQTLCNYYRNDERFRGQSELLTFFSGDAFNPSLESSVTKGPHMVPVLNNIGTDVACVGNHDLDFGIRQYRHLTSQCKFPWLLANVLDPALGENVSLGNAGKTTILTSSNGIKVGVIGLAEREWLDTINSLPPDLIFKSASQTAKELIPKLREQGAELVVALTHQREPNDNKLAEVCGEGLVDVVLGGHDHYYAHSYVNGVHVLRSGSDFKQLSHIECRRRKEGKGWDFTITRRDTVSSVAKDEEAEKLVEKLTSSLRKKLDKPIGYTAAPLDARFTTVRIKESNIGNFVCDLMRYYYQADCCIMAAGTIRGDQIYPPGILRLRDLVNCFPFEDPVVVIKVTGKAIIEALENGVSSYPALEGRFPQVSNIRFEADYSKEPMSRISAVMIGEQPVELEKEYVLSTRGYMARGKDGYTSLLIEEEGGKAKELVSEENGVLISTILRQYFMSLKVIGKWKLWGPSMDRTWGKMQQEIQQSHPVLEPQPPGTKAVEALRSTAKHISPDRSNSSHSRSLSPSGRYTPGGVHPEGSETPLDESADEFGSDDDGAPDEGKAVSIIKHEHELNIIRRVIKKWWRLTGLKGHPGICDELGAEEFQVNWTKAIAPRVEGRIREINATADK
ncbi:5'-nucleotidase-like protein [Delitschia confertaspora ATCC 74209]|uniref:5'-nucleotidase-like protein n=1 Tax=Delitschia confertaspora ATCC 74209 TaxID=1513339 RepID=A0A9P4JL23_9PLEO|nr:5'-nucleotidase-like protein [Delitschia confertaspora ATCC 74209]